MVRVKERHVGDACNTLTLVGLFYCLHKINTYLKMFGNGRHLNTTMVIVFYYDWGGGRRYDGIGGSGNSCSSGSCSDGG